MCVYACMCTAYTRALDFEKKFGRALLARPLPQAVKSALVQTLAEVLLARCKAEGKQGGGHGSQIAELRVLMEMWAVCCVSCA